MHICLFEDPGVHKLAPLSLTRPAFELRCGAVSLRERQERILPGPITAALVRPELTELCRDTHPSLEINEPLGLGQSLSELVLLVNSRWLAPVESRPRTDQPGVGVVEDQVAYVVVPASEVNDLSLTNISWRLAEWQRSLPTHPAGGLMIDYPWDLVEFNGAALADDHQIWSQRGVAEAKWTSRAGPADRFLVAHSAEIEPMVHVDTTTGPVLIDDGAVVQAFSRLQGPCYIGKGTRILSARIHGGSIGPQCRIGGEVEASIVHGYSNKAHEGFLGHSYVGAWVNLAAGTHTSDLRTDYGLIRMSVEGRMVDTGLLKIGSFIGDHTKTSLNTLFNTGSQIGVFGQLLGGDDMLPRIVPSFCRHASNRLRERTNLREMFDTAATMMARRGQRWQEIHAEFFITLLEETTLERRQLLREQEQRRVRRVV
jgi:UDP-N-acetylglucosamine diphosphorylase/glucosamine-1-phosphate N-acetyltransferase